MSLLKVRSDRIRQNVTYNCLNSRAHMKILMNDEEELHNFSEDVHMISDDCDRNDGVWRKAVFELDTTQLPIVDIAVEDIYDKDQNFRISIGPVCFE